MLKFAGLNPALYGLHSPRIGGATDAFYNHIPYHIIDQQGRWKDPKTKHSYLRLDEKRFTATIVNASRY